MNTSRQIIILCMFFITILFSEMSFAGVPQPIVNAIVTVESSNNPDAVSQAGCRGLGQIKKETWYWVCKLMGVQWSFNDAFDTEKNLAVTQFYLNWIEDYLKQNNRYSEELLFASYNAGPGAVRKYNWQVPPYRETITYVKKVKQELLNQEMTASIY